MFIHRHPCASTISTRGASGSAAPTATPRAREDRRKRGLGREGMLRTERVVGQGHLDAHCTGATSVDRLLATRHSWHIQRGGGTGPMKPRQPPHRPPRGRRGKVPIPEDVWRESTRTISAAPITAEGFENDGQGTE